MELSGPAARIRRVEPRSQSRCEALDRHSTRRGMESPGSLFSAVDNFAGPRKPPKDRESAVRTGIFLPVAQLAIRHPWMPPALEFAPNVGAVNEERSMQGTPRRGSVRKNLQRSYDAEKRGDRMPAGDFPCNRRLMNCEISALPLVWHQKQGQQVAGHEPRRDRSRSWTG